MIFACWRSKNEEELIGGSASGLSRSDVPNTLHRFGIPGGFDFGLIGVKGRQEKVSQLCPFTRRMGHRLIFQVFDNRVHGG